MDNQSGHVMTLANSIIGVSILAMPYCFKQCGVVLSVIILLVSSVISRLACHFLLKSAIIARRKTFEYLAFHIFGALGKFAIEIGIIGFLLGTCIAFFVVMGDLGPEIVSEITGFQTSNATRSGILIALAMFCVLPLGLLKNVDSLNGVSKATIGFYCCLVLKIIIEALPHFFSGDWLNNVVLWRPKGILQCLPIFSMALFCQTQLFEIYQALPNASLEKMNSLIRVAVNICTWVYIFVGAFGYIAFSQKDFAGNILLSFRPSIMSDVMKIGFVMSLAFSFPLVIFPCRASLYSLLYKGPSYTLLHEGTSNYIPEGKFKALTLIIVLISLSLGIVIPNIELVLGLVGSTIGVMICVLFPVTCFICISPKNTNERILAQIMLFVGIVVMVLGTYANLYAFEEAHLNVATEKVLLSKEDPIINNPKESIEDAVQNILIESQKLAQEKNNVMDIPTTVKTVVEKSDDQIDDLPPNLNQQLNKNNLKEVRHEPPQPVEPIDSHVSVEPKKDDVKKPPIEKISSKVEKSVFEEKIDLILPNKEKETAQVVLIDQQGPVVEPVVPNELNQPKEYLKENKPEPPETIKEVEVGKDTNEKVEKSPIGPEKKNDEVDIEAIKKEDKELKEQEKEKNKDLDFQNQQLLESIQQQHKVQKEIVEQQKKLIQVIQNQQANVRFDDNNNADFIKKVNEEKLKAVKQIEIVARKAIESISAQDHQKPDDQMNEEDKLKNKEKLKVKVNPAPLSYQLGLNNNNNSDSRISLAQQSQNNTNKVQLLPLPIALAKDVNDVKNKTIVSNDSTGEKNTKNIEKLVKVEEIQLINNNISVQDTKQNVDSHPRDVQENESEGRAKRDVIEVEKAVNDLNKVCEEIEKSTRTERPKIKMLCKLSEPSLANIGLDDLKAAESNSADLMKPQKRDLKFFQEESDDE